MNLVVNAKDAMPEGGKLTLQSSDVTVRQNFSEQRFIQPGRYAVISVTDTGHGMDKETQSRIFEPFFTTKEKGKGTGLGLSTVYGIVKQSNGYVFAQSEVGAGTTFHVYLPRVEDSAEEVRPAKSPQNEAGGCETVLLVEDEESVRELVRLTLASRGYNVLEAENGECGLRIAETCKEPIDILITDVVMPGIGGRELAKKLLALRPGISVLYLSGYTEDTVITHGAPRSGHRLSAETLHPSESRQESPRGPALPIRSQRPPASQSRNRLRTDLGAGYGSTDCRKTQASYQGIAFTTSGKTPIKAADVSPGGASELSPALQRWEKRKK